MIHRFEPDIRDNSFAREGGAHSKVEGDLLAYFVYPGVETCLFVRVNFVREGSGMDGPRRKYEN